jgi:undecaprenyl-diphosphatase
MFGALTVLVATAWSPLADADADLLPVVRDPASEHRWLRTASSAIGYALGPWTFRLVAVIVVIVLLTAARTRRRPEPLHRTALFVLVAVAFGGLLSGMVKELVGRRRPAPAIALAQAPGASYPSGHAVGITVTVIVILVAVLAATGRRPRPWLWASGLLAVVAVGLSRVALGVHYPSDVLGGFLLGLAWATGTAAAVLPPPPGAAGGRPPAAAPRRQRGDDRSDPGRERREP